MTHVSRQSYIGLDNDGFVRMPVTIYKTLCGKTVRNEKKINNLQPTCEECNNILTWEEIDRKGERSTQ